MSKPRVIQADFASFRTVAGRKVLQIVCEVPIEKAGEALELLGVPVHGESRWVAIALLNKDSPVAQRSERAAYNRQVEGSNPSGATSSSSERSEAAPTKTPFHELPSTKQAAIRCADTRFQAFLLAESEAEAAVNVRRICGVASRKDLNFDEGAAVRWDKLEQQYQSYLTDQKYQGVRR